MQEPYTVSSVGVLLHTGSLERGGFPKFVLVEQLDVEGHPFGIPAGRAEEMDITAVGTAIREVYDETGLEIEPKRLQPFVDVVHATAQIRRVFSYHIGWEELGELTYDFKTYAYHLRTKPLVADEIGRILLVRCDDVFLRGGAYALTYRWDISREIKAKLESRRVI